jgi:protein-L-isoaspartate(D-aspartate) O-methyltransferase
VSSNKRPRSGKQQLALPFGEVAHNAHAIGVETDQANDHVYEHNADEQRDVPPSGYAQSIMHFLLRLRENGIGHVDILRALETVPRDIFVPHRLVDLAWRDLALPIACGQTMPPPILVARMLECAQIKPDHRVLEIGTGSGYSAAILARLARDVVSIERFQTLVTQARARLATMSLSHVQIIWDDGLAIKPELGHFDRILVHGFLSDIPSCLREALSPNGVLVCAGHNPASAAPHSVKARARPLQQLMRVSMAANRQSTSIAFFGACALPPLMSGRSLGL